MYNTQAINACRSAFREVVERGLGLVANQGTASIFPCQELTRHRDRHPSYPLFFSSWGRDGGDVELIALRNTGFGRTAASCEGFMMMCVASCVYRCYRVCLRVPVGLCRTHISGRCSLFFRRVIALYSFDIGKRVPLPKARSNETCSL